MAISTLAIKPVVEAHDRLQSPCLDPVSQQDGNVRLTCTSLRVMKTLLKKKPEPDKGPIWAVMERHGLKEFLLFVQR